MFIFFLTRYFYNTSLNISNKLQLLLLFKIRLTAHTVFTNFINCTTQITYLRCDLKQNLKL